MVIDSLGWPLSVCIALLVGGGVYLIMKPDTVRPKARPPVPVEPTVAPRAASHWAQLGKETGLSGAPSEAPDEIWQEFGTVPSPALRAWQHAWREGNRQHLWDKGFAAGTAGEIIAGTDWYETTGWSEGNAKRLGLPYFPSISAPARITDPKFESQSRPSV
jgi:hypothetical protein